MATKLIKTEYNNKDGKPKDVQTEATKVGAWDMEQIVTKVNEVIDGTLTAEQARLITLFGSGETLSKQNPTLQYGLKDGVWAEVVGGSTNDITSMLINGNLIDGFTGHNIHDGLSPSNFFPCNTAIGTSLNADMIALNGGEDRVWKDEITTGSPNSESRWQFSTNFSEWLNNNPTKKFISARWYVETTEDNIDAHEHKIVFRNNAGLAFVITSLAYSQYFTTTRINSKIVEVEMKFDYTEAVTGLPLQTTGVGGYFETKITAMTPDIGGYVCIAALALTVGDSVDVFSKNLINDWE